MTVCIIICDCSWSTRCAACSASIPPSPGISTSESEVSSELLLSLLEEVKLSLSE